MERKSARKVFVLAVTFVFLMGITAAHAQWWTSSSSTSSSTTSSSTTSSSSTSSSSTSSSSTSSTSSSSSGSVVVDPSTTGSYTKCTYTPPSNTGYSEAQVWYPCSGAGPFAATTLTSGYTGTYSDIAYLADHLVTHGYIVFAMTPNNNYGNNPTWTTAHRSGIAQLKKENTRTGTTFSPNPIKGKVDTTRLQVMGHSKGGGGTLLASNALGSAIKTAQALTPYMDYSYSLSGTRAKTNCITGTEDTIASPSAVVTMYNSLPDSIDRTLIYFQGLDHMVFTTDGSEPYKTRSTRYITAFMKYHLEDNSSYQTYLYGAKHTEAVNAGWFYGYSHNADF